MMKKVHYINSERSPENKQQKVDFHDKINRDYSKLWLQSDMKTKKGPIEVETLLHFPEANGLICTICSRFDMSTDIEFTALDTLNVLFEKYLVKLKEAIETDASAENIELCWGEAQRIFKDDGLITVLLVVGIVEKLIGGNGVMSARTIKAIAEKLDLHYELKEIVEREFHLFKMLDFHVPEAHSLRVTELLVKELLDASKFNIEFETFMTVCTSLLRMLYLHKGPIYGRLRENVTDAELMKRMTMDSVLQGATVVNLASDIYKIPNQLPFLSDESMHDETDISALERSLAMTIEEM